MEAIRFSTPITVEGKVYTQSLTEDFALTETNNQEELERFAKEQIFRSHGFDRVRLDGVNAVKEDQYSAAFEDYRYVDVEIGEGHAYLPAITDILNNLFKEIEIVDANGNRYNKPKLNARIGDFLNSTTNTKYPRYLGQFVDMLKAEVSRVAAEVAKAQGLTAVNTAPIPVATPTPMTEIVQPQVQTTTNEPVVVAKNLTNPFQPIIIDEETGKLVGEPEPVMETPTTVAAPVVPTNVEEVNNMLTKYPLLKQVYDHAITHGWNLVFAEMPNGIIEMYPYKDNIFHPEKAITIDLNGLIYNCKPKWWPYCRSISIDKNIPLEQLPLDDFSLHSMCEFLNKAPGETKLVLTESLQGYMAINKFIDLATIRHPKYNEIITTIGNSIMNIIQVLEPMFPARLRFESFNESNGTLTLIADPNISLFFGFAPIGNPANPVRFVVEQNKPVRIEPVTVAG